MLERKQYIYNSEYLCILFILFHLTWILPMFFIHQRQLNREISLAVPSKYKFQNKAFVFSLLGKNWLLESFSTTLVILSDNNDLYDYRFLRFSIHKHVFRKTWHYYYWWIYIFICNFFLIDWIIIFLLFFFSNNYDHSH